MPVIQNNDQVDARFDQVIGDRIAIARGTSSNGDFAPRGSGVNDRPIRLTAYGQGPRPRIIAAASDRQVLLLFNQEYWQIDSLDLSGALSLTLGIGATTAVFSVIWAVLFGLWPAWKMSRPEISRMVPRPWLSLG